jgi:hypothetical protein
MKKFFWFVGALLLAILLLAAGWFFGREQAGSYDPYQDLKSYTFSRHKFLIKSAEISVKMANRAIVALKKKHIYEAINDCKTAIDIFPIDAKPYILLTKLYLMTGQEEKLYDTLTLAGRSYPNFDNIVSVIDDDDLDKIPLDQPQSNVYLAAFPGNRKTAVSFMFDDGEANIYKALPTFEKYGLRVTIPVVAGYVSDKSNDPFWGSWAEWRDAANRGFEIANHSMFHRDSKNLKGSDFDVAIDQAQEIIQENTGHKVTAYVFPHDSYTDEAVGRALRHHEAIRTPEFLHSFYNREVDIVLGGPYVSVETANRLVDIGIKRNLWLIMKCHGVTEKRSMRSFKSITPDFLEKHLSYIHEKSDDVWVDTFSHVFEYMAQRKQADIETKDSTANSIDFLLHANTPKAKLTVPLTVVVKTQAADNVKSVTTADGRQLKAWPCGPEKLCVDVDSFNDTIHVVW